MYKKNLFFPFSRVKEKNKKNIGKIVVLSYTCCSFYRIRKNLGKQDFVAIIHSYSKN